MGRKGGLCAALLAFALYGTAAAAADGNKPGTFEWVPELTPYQADLGFYLTLGRPLVERDGDDELEIYRELLFNSAHPQVVVLQASAYPVPMAGVWMRRHNRDAYDDAELDSLNLNWIQSLTSGFLEPVALSVFLGSVINFARPGERRLSTNKGKMGYQVRGGDRHIRENEIVPDDWYEIEWKLEGDRLFSNDHLSWKFSLGTKQNSNPEIADTGYVRLRRSNLDYRAPLLSFLTNSELSLVVAWTTHDAALARAELIAEKRYPLKLLNCGLALQFGVIVEKNRQYSGSLVERGGAHPLIFVLRPNLEF